MPQEPRLSPPRCTQVKGLVLDQKSIAAAPPQREFRDKPAHEKRDRHRVASFAVLRKDVVQGGRSWILLSTQ